MNSNTETPAKYASNITWINEIKGIAIIAVFVAHTYGIIYENLYLLVWSFFSVTLFVFVGGITSYVSCTRRKISLGKYIVKRISKILSAYIFATLIISIINLSIGYFKIEEIPKILLYVLSFRFQSVDYYIMFFIQLILISPLLFREICYESNHNGIRHLCMIFLILLLDYLTVNYFHLDDSFYGGAKYLLGGPYLLVFYVGMLFEHYHGYQFIKDNKKYCFPIIFLIFAFFICNMIKINQFSAVLGLYTNCLFPNELNPPGISLILYSLSMAAFIIVTDIILNSKEIPLLCFIGKHSLFLYLFHFYIMTIASNYFVISTVYSKILLVLAMFILPIILEKFYSHILTKMTTIANK